MKRLTTALFFLFALQTISHAQLTTLADGGNRKAMVSERVGLTDITISYSRPGVKAVKGKIWGQLVPYGFYDQGFGTSKAAPWRAGANEGTTISFSTPVTIEGKELPAGKYGFFIAVGKDESTVIFSKNNTAWGSFFYDPSEDVLRVPCKQQALDKSVETLQYQFTAETDDAATIVLQWEKLAFPFKVQTDLKQNQIISFRKELQTEKGFVPDVFVQAANWCVDNNVNLEEALRWADYAISAKYIGQKTFTTLSAKARVLDKMGKKDEAMAVMKEAAPLGSMAEVHRYARQLMTDKRTAEAAAFFKDNYKKFPNTFVTNMGMMRAMSSEGKYKEALKYANAALPQAPDDANKKMVEATIDKLKAGQDVN